MSERWTPAYDRLFDPEHELRQHEPVCRAFAWLDLCRMAQFEGRTRIIGSQAVRLQRGEFIASYRFLAERWSWSVKRVRTFLDSLTDPVVGKLKQVRGTPSGTVYHVVSYDTYANPGHSDGHTGGTDGAQGGHTRGTPGAQIITSSTKEVSGNIMGGETPKQGRKKKATRLPEDWTPNDEHVARAKKAKLDLGWQADKFRAHAAANDVRKVRWNAAFTTWLMNAEEWKRPNGHAPSFGDETARDEKRHRDAVVRKSQNDAETAEEERERAERDREEAWAWWEEQDVATRQRLEQEAKKRCGGAKTMLQPILLGLIHEARTSDELQQSA